VGSWNKAKVIDYTNLKRMSVAHLLKIMKSNLPTVQNLKFKIALEIVSKDIGKQAPQAPVVNQFFFQELLERAGVLSGRNSIFSRN
jgi:hypothetical protein